MRKRRAAPSVLIPLGGLSADEEQSLRTVLRLAKGPGLQARTRPCKAAATPPGGAPKSFPIKFRAGLVCGLGLLLGGTAGAAELGTVLSFTPVTAQVGVPQTQCVDEEQTVQARPSRLGAVAGALIGGAIGHNAAGGPGRGAATAPTQTTTVRQCQNVTRYETRVVGYDVVYDYAGVRYQSRLAQDPGPRIAFHVGVVPVGAAAPAMVTSQAVVVAPPPVAVVEVGPPRGHRPRPYGY